MADETINPVDPHVLAAASAELERLCSAAGLEVKDISGPDLSGRRRRVRNEAVMEIRRTTPACYSALGQLLDADPANLQRSVRGALEIPHW